MALTLGTLYRDNSTGKVFWCDNYGGSLVLRHIQSAAVLNGVFDGPLESITNPQENGELLRDYTFLAKADNGPDIYLIDNYDGNWRKRHILNMDVFRSRHFKQGTIETVRWNLLDGVANGTPIDS